MDVNMLKAFRLNLVWILLLMLAACNLGGGPDPSLTGETSVLRLTVQAQNAGDNFSTPGQVINYGYTVTNTGSSPLAGPVIINDPGRQVTCPPAESQGNADIYLDLNETITCTGTYSITATDLTTGSVINVATANAGGVTSNQAGVTVQMNAGQSSPLTLTKTASPTTYNQIGQSITYTYVITNTGAAPVGPAQFMVTDNRLAAPVSCGPANSTLATNQSVTCTSTYVITQSDMLLTNITNSATASGGGAPTSAPATATVTNLSVSGVTPGTPSSPPNLPAGTTIQHQVIKGEWLIQIARCYGTGFEAVRNANPQIRDPHLILPEMVVTVPNIGSVGRIYGPPCITVYTVVSGDTWESIAQKYNADVTVLKTRNAGALSAGRVVYVPNNSAGGASVPPPPQATRLNIPPGSSSVSQVGSLAGLETDRYVLNATQGQSMTVRVTTTATGVSLAIYNPAGTAIKPADATLTWTGTVAQTGDHRIDIANTTTTANVSYTLEVSLSAAPAPITASPTLPPGGNASFQQAADVNAGQAGSSPAFLAEFNGVLYFQADGGDGTGKELWRYDGTSAGRAADINSGGTGSNPSYLTVYNGALYFAATGSDGAGNELWRFDGTSAARAADIWAGAESSNPASLIVFNNMLYFTADGNDGAGYELWKFDGTTATRAADILSGADSSTPVHPAVFGGALYFQADGGDGMGYELWKFDGTTATRAADIWAGSGNSNPSHLTVFNNALYFSANGNDGAGTELWRFDGTTATRAADIWSGMGDSNPSYLAVHNGVLYFNANGNDGGGQKLWRFDGTTATRVPDTGGVSVSSPAFLVPHKNALYFQADGNNATGPELWRYTG